MSINGCKVEELEVGIWCGFILYYEVYEVYGDNGWDYNVREFGLMYIIDLVDDVLINIWKWLLLCDLWVVSFVLKDWEKKMVLYLFVDEYVEEWEIRYEDIFLLVWVKIGEFYLIVVLDIVMKCQVWVLVLDLKYVFSDRFNLLIDKQGLYVY